MAQLAQCQEAGCLSITDSSASIDKHSRNGLAVGLWLGWVGGTLQSLRLKIKFFLGRMEGS